MNWLAHVFLSQPQVEFRLGNLLADVVRGSQRASMSEDFLRGVRCHQAIDSFTDAHAIVKRSRSRIGPELRRFSGVLIDVFYDHFLAADWDRYSAESLTEFTSEFYADTRAVSLDLPVAARMILDRIIRHDLLGSYLRVDGVERSLRRLSMGLTERWHREFALERGVDDMLRHEHALAEDFAEFFPQLQAHVAAHIAAANAS